MLKVVGASWLQTRISTYILVAVGLLGIGAILLGEFGRVEKDGTYSATVFWNHKGGYRIDFWGQANDLTSLPKGAARAYYKTRIQETGWSIVEIETSSSYPDAVQAYAAGLLEGSLTWQLIHHHWYNTIGALCSVEENENFCSKTREKLRKNTAVIRERANLLASEDSFWHMVRLFYAQLEGMEAGWRFAVRRSRRSVEIETEDFLWLAMASDLTQSVETKSMDESSHFNDQSKIPSTWNANNSSVIFVKSIDRSSEGLEPLIAIAQNTVAPYAKMLRLLKRYSFGYHLSEGKNSPRAPTRSILMSSYPGALSSHDEYYVVRGGKDNDDLLILAGIPLRGSMISSSLADSKHQKDSNEDEEEKDSIIIQGVMSPARIMSANRLATESRSWSRHLSRGSNPSKNQNARTSSIGLQWIALKPRDSTVWMIEQHSSTTHAVDNTQNFRKNGFVLCDGVSILKSSILREQLKNENRTSNDSLVDPQGSSNTDINEFYAKNITSVDDIRNLMLGNPKFIDEEIFAERENSSSSKSSNNESFQKTESHSFSGQINLEKFVYRGDLENPPKPIGTIDNKMALVTVNGIESFEATSGPPFGHNIDGSPIRPYDWSLSFPNRSHIGQPPRFAFDSVIPHWIWF